MKQDLKSFNVYRRIDESWEFWFTARGVSAKQICNSVRWLRWKEVKLEDKEPEQ